MSITLFMIPFSYLIMASANLLCKMSISYMAIFIQFRLIIEKNKSIEIGRKDGILTEYIMVSLLEFLYQIIKFLFMCIVIDFSN